MARKSGYMFTNKNHPEKAIMSSVLGIICLFSIALSVYYSFQSAGQAAFQYGTVILLTLIFSLAGETLGVISKFEKEKFYFFSYLGITLNTLSLAAISFILYAGAYGL